MIINKNMNVYKIKTCQLIKNQQVSNQTNKN